MKLWNMPICSTDRSRHWFLSQHGHRWPGKVPDPTGETPSILDIGLRRQRRWCSGKSPWNSRHVDVYPYYVCLSYLSAGSMNLEDSSQPWIDGLAMVSILCRCGIGLFIRFQPEITRTRCQEKSAWIHLNTWLRPVMVHACPCYKLKLKEIC